MSLLGQQQRLETFLELKARIATRQGLLLKEQRRLDAESATLEQLLQKRHYQQLILMQSHLATDAIHRLSALSERAAQTGPSTTEGEALLNEEFAKADRRFNARMLFVGAGGALFRADEQSFGVLKATHILDGRREFIHALHQCERQEAILKWVGETSEVIEQWKKEKWPHLDAHAADDPQREAIFTAGEPVKVDDRELKGAKARYLTLLGDVTLLVDQVRHLESLSSATEAERDQVERQAKTESHRLSKIYAQHLFNGATELEAYRSAAEALAAAHQVHSKRLDATHQNALVLERIQIDALLDRVHAFDPVAAKAYREQMDRALSDHRMDALAHIRRDLAELDELAEQARARELARELDAAVALSAHRQEQEEHQRVEERSHRSSRSSR